MSVRGVVWGIPGGRADPNESSVQAAARELSEETGLEAQNLEHMVSFNPAAPIMSHWIHAYLAKDPVETGRGFDPHELDGLVWVSFDRLKTMLQQGKIFDGPSVICLQHFLLFHQP